MQTGGGTNNTTGDAMVIGNGTELSARSNAFRVTFAGAVYGVGSFHTSGADYSEYFEWDDGNPDAEDRVGRFVTLEGDKLKLAGPGDYLLGIVSGNYDEAHDIMNDLAEVGVNFKDVTDKLEADGVAAFIKSWDSVLSDVQAGIDRVNG